MKPNIDLHDVRKRAAILIIALATLLISHAALAAPSITATMADDVTLATKKNPGNTISYTTTISNSNAAGTTDATVVTFTNAAPANTAAGTLNATPVAVDDTYSQNIVANMSVNTATSGFSVLSNDFLGYAADVALSASDAAVTVTVTTNPAHGTVTFNASPKGTFTYTPTAGYTGTDSFGYTVTNGVAGTPAGSNVGTVGLNVVGPVVWFVDATNGADAPTGKGTLGAPFKAKLTDVTAVDAANQKIFVYQGSYSTGITLKDGEALIGQGAQGGTFDNFVLGFTPGTDTPARPSTGGTRPSLSNAAGNAITLGENNLIVGLNVTGASASGISGSNKNAVTIGNASPIDVAISGTTGNGLSLSGGAGTCTINATITNSAGHSVNIITRGAGAIDFTQAISDSGTGILLDNNDQGSNAVITFRGGLDISTGANAGFTATNGGTVNVCATADCASGSAKVNAIATTTETALNVANTTIGSSGLTFRSIAAGTGSDSAGAGIILDNTGANAGLTVTGTGSAGSGGTIQHKNGSDINTVNTDGTLNITGTTGVGIFLRSTKNPSFSWMALHDFTNFAILGSSVTGFTLAHVVTSGVNGSNPNVHEGTINFDNLTPSASITNTTIAGGVSNNFSLINTSGTLNRITFDTCTFGAMDSGNVNGNDSLFIQGRNTATVNVTVTNTSMTSARGDMFQVDLTDTATSDVIFKSNTVNNQHPFVIVGGGGLTFSGGGATGAAPTLTYDVGGATAAEGNTFRGARGDALLVVFQTGHGTATGKIRHNTFGVSGVDKSGASEASDIDIRTVGRAAQTVLIDSNTTLQYANAGIMVQAGDNSVAGTSGIIGEVHATITNNTVSEFNSNASTKAGIHINLGTTASPSDTTFLCADIQNNNAPNAGSTDSSAGSDYVVRQRQSTTMRLPGYGGTSSDTTAVANYIKGRNVNGASSSVFVATPSGGGGYVGGATCTQPLLLGLGGVEAAASAPQCVAGNAGGVAQDKGAMRTARPVVSPKSVDAALPIKPLSQSELDSLVATAVQRWEAAGLTKEELTRLRQLKFEVADLTGLRLGEASGDLVRVDRRAGGAGWFIGTGTSDDILFTESVSETRGYADPTAAPAGHIDLLTAILHEMGHVIGLSDTYAEKDRDKVMYGFLTKGERRVPAKGDAAGAIPGSATHAEFLTSPIAIGTLPKGKSVVITYNVTINAATTAATISNQGTVSGSNFSNVVTNDPETTAANDATITRVEQPPVVSNVAVSVNEEATKTFAASDFTPSFSDPNVGLADPVVAGDSLQTVRIASLPTNGVLKNNGTTIAAVPVDIAISNIGLLTYVPNTNFNGSDSFNWNGSDGTLFALSNATVNITVSAVNDPVTASAPATLTVAEDSSSNAVAGLSIADVDATLAPNGVYEVVFSATNGKLTLSTLTGLTFTAGDGTADATMTFHGKLADINSGLATATYAPNADYNGSDSIVLHVTDTFGGVVATGTGVATSDQKTVAVTVTAVNDPVSATAPASLSVNEDSSNNAVAGMSISDVDTVLAPNGIYEVQLSSTQGTMTMTTLTGLTFTGGDGTADASMTFHGKLADINTALATAKYTPTGNANGAAQIVLDVVDIFSGVVATGSGASTHDAKTISVTINAVNDPPSFTKGPDQTVFANSGAASVPNWATSISAGPPDESGQQVDFIVTNDNNTLFSGQPAVSASGTLTFTPATNHNGSANVTVKIHDNGGGTDTSAPQTFVITVNKNGTTTNLTSSPNPSGTNIQVTFTATVSSNTAVTGPPTGTVNFIDTSNGNAAVCSNVALSSGQAQCQTSTLSTGSTHNIQAHYNGDGAFDVSDSNIVAQVVLNCSNPAIVTDTGDNGGIDPAANAGTGTLRQALVDVCDGGTITFNIPGGPSIITLSAQLVIGKNVTITGPGADMVTVSGNSVSRVFQINPGKTVAISNLTIANGSATGSFPDSDGGGVFNDHSNLTLTACVINANSAADSGGGIFNSANGSGTATATITDCTFSGNNATGSGAAIFNSGDTGTATLNVVSSTFTGNLAGGAGSGIANLGSAVSGVATANIVNTTISGNTSNSDGGGLFNSNNASPANATMTLTNVTVTNNYADGDNNTTGDGGGIRVDSGTVTLKNTIVAGNFKSNLTPVRNDVSGALDSSSSHNFIGDGTGMTGITDGDGNGNHVGTLATPIDPLLGSLDKYGGPTKTQLPAFGSPVIDAGTDWTTLSANITNADTTMPVADATGIAIGSTIRIDSEQMVVTNKAGNSLTVTRSAGATSHTSGAAVNAAFDQRGFSRRLDGPDDPDTTATVDIGAVEANYEVTATGGTPQSAANNTAFGAPLKATVSESGITLVTTGVQVTFAVTPAGNGASASFTSANPATSDPSGVAQITVTANNIIGGPYTVTATATGYNGQATFSLTNTAGSATHFSVTAPSAATAGTPFNTLVVKALDGGENVDTGYTGTVHFTSSDGQAVLPADSTLTNGQGTFSATLKTAGNQTITATDTVSAITGTSNIIAVSAAAATHFGVTAPSTGPPTATENVAFNFTIVALDQFNNVDTNYTGTIHPTSNDGAATLPGDYTFTLSDAGSKTFSATLRTPGNRTIGDTDTSSAINGTSGTITVSAATVTHFGVVAPSSATAGTAFNFTVTALDAGNNTVGSYAGNVHFTSSDGAAVLPVNSPLSSGSGTFSATLKTAGNQTISVNDTVATATTGTSNTIAVGAAGATHFSVSAPASASAGTQFNVTVTALDQFNNTATGYTGTVHFTSTDGGAALPTDDPLTNGTGTFKATLNTAGNQTITAKDTSNPAIAGTSGTINVGAGAAVNFVLSAPASATAGTPFNFTITAQDQASNTATGYTGTVHFTSNDNQAVLPADTTLVNGTGTFSATLKTAASNQIIQGRDTGNASIFGTSNNINVSAQAATHFLVSAPGGATAGSAFNFTVTAQDQFNNTATSYAGTVHFTSTDGAAVLPADSTLSSGAGNFSATLKTAGNQTLTAKDTANMSIAGTSATIVVAAANATHFSVSAPASATAGNAFNFTVTAQDQFNNTDVAYAGTVHFTSTDGQAQFPANQPLPNGSGTFGAILKTAGNQTITATDSVTLSITGTSGAINVGAASATHFAVTAPASATANSAFNFVVTALDQFNNTATAYAGTVHFTSSDGAAVLPADNTLVNGTRTFSATLKTAGNQTITAKDTADATISGTSNPIAVSPGPATHFTLTAPASAQATAAFNFTVTAQDQFNNTATAYAGTVHFTSSDGAAVLPANSTLTNGVGMFSATLKTPGNQTITATDTGNASINGTTNAIAVSKASTTTSVNSSANPSSSGQNVTFTATVTVVAPGTGTPTGTVQFVIDGSNTGAPVTLSGNTAQFSTSSLSSGNHPVVAQYSGDGTFLASNGSLSGGQNVNAPTPTPTATATATATATPTATATATPTATATATPTATATASPTPTATASASPSATPTATPTGTPTSTPAQSLNISTRLRVDTGDKVMIGGFIIRGNASKSVVLRGMGPSLANAGLPAASVLQDPTLELHGPNGALITSNDNWVDSPQKAQIQGTIFQPTDDRESVILATLQPGAYTAVLSGVGNTAGIGLVEIYDTNQAVDSDLANISTRGFVLINENVMIGGFTIGGNQNATRIVVRALGPSLASFGLSNLLADPMLELHNANGTIMISNDNWTDDPTSAAELFANGLAPQNANEAAIFTSLAPPGQFTAIVVGKNGGTGIALVEIYNLR